MNRISQILNFILIWSFTLTVCGQEPMSRNWDASKITGTRFLPYPSYTGFPFLNDSWVLGKVEFMNGEISDTLRLKYSSFKDELVYFNTEISTQIVIDKTSLSGFSYIDNLGKSHYFRKQFYDGFLKGDRYFEVLSSGKTDLVVFRRVSLNNTSQYQDASGILKNMIYNTDYQYFFYSQGKGYTYVRPNNTALITKFNRDSQKPIRKLLRKNRISIESEETFILAWKLIENGGYEIEF